MGTEHSLAPDAPVAAPANWRSRATVTVSEYAAIVGIGRNTAYEAARAGQVQTIKVRGRILVCVPAAAAGCLARPQWMVSSAPQRKRPVLSGTGL
jgi:hypothetical protein